MIVYKFYLHDAVKNPAAELRGIKIKT